MHLLHTTDAFILASYPHGEHSRAYKLLTRTHGLLYAHGQGVRELRNRNRYALRSHSCVSVTLVRGRDTWRITGAREGALMRPGHVRWRRTLSFAGRLLPVEDPVPDTFDLLVEAHAAMSEAADESTRTLEALVLLKILHELGYVPRPHHGLTERIVAEESPLAELATKLTPERNELTRIVNTVLHTLPAH